MRFVLFISIVQSITLRGTLVLVQDSGQLSWSASPAKLLTLKVALTFPLCEPCSDFLSRLPLFHIFGPVLLHCCGLLAGNGLSFNSRIDLCLDFPRFGRMVPPPLNRKILIEVLIGMPCSRASMDHQRRSDPYYRISVQRPLLPSPWKGKTAVWGERHSYWAR